VLPRDWLQDRISILGTVTRRAPLAADVDLARIAADPRCTDFSGADLAGITITRAGQGRYGRNVAASSHPLGSVQDRCA
jgi:ATP-dependent 26S proteasome regulatory subunit